MTHPEDLALSSRAFAFLGLMLILFVCWLASEHRKKVSWRTVSWGLGLQVVLGLLLFGVSWAHIPGLAAPFFSFLNAFVVKLVSFSDVGAAFVFGKLAQDNTEFGYIFAFRTLPTIIFFSAFTGLLYHTNALPWLVKRIAALMERTMRIRGAESLSTAANVFLGQIEAPLTVKPYLSTMSRSELFTVMVGGFASTAGGVLAAFVAMLSGAIPNIAGHLITVSVLSAPASILIAKMLIPETTAQRTDNNVTLDLPRDANVFEAIARGAQEGLGLALSVAAMLIAFVALMAGLSYLFATCFGFFGVALELSQALGILLRPVALLLGCPWADTQIVGELLAKKILINEFVAYGDLALTVESLSPRAALVASYALCGFANFTSIGIQIGGIGAMAPERRGDIARMGLKAMIAGNLATFTSTCIVAILI